MVDDDEKWVWQQYYASHSHPTEASAGFKHYAKKLGKDQKISKNIVATKKLKPQATKNIERFENISWSPPFYSQLDLLALSILLNRSNNQFWYLFYLSDYFWKQILANN